MPFKPRSGDGRFSHSRGFPAEKHRFAGVIGLTPAGLLLKVHLRPPPSSSGPGRRVLSPKTGVRLPVGVFKTVSDGLIQDSRIDRDRGRYGCFFAPSPSFFGRPPNRAGVSGQSGFSCPRGCTTRNPADRCFSAPKPFFWLPCPGAARRTFSLAAVTAKRHDRARSGPEGLPVGDPCPIGPVFRVPRLLERHTHGQKRTMAPARPVR